MQQTGVVLETNGKKATVRFKRSDACGKCNACFSFGKTETDIEIDNPIGAKKGDVVVIELHGKSVFKASLIMYGIPIVMLVIGVLIGSAIGDVYGAVGGILLAGGSFFILRALEPRLSKMSEFKPRVVAVQGPPVQDDNRQEG